MGKNLGWVYGIQANDYVPADDDTIHTRYAFYSSAYVEESVVIVSISAP